MATTTAPAAAKTPALSKHRLDALSDGLFAIVMTLLVLELKVPEIAKHSTASELWHSLLEVLPTLFSFLITFMLASIFWRIHAVVIEWTSEIRGKLLFLNLAGLFFVSLLPFSTAILGRFLQNSAAQTIYFLNQFAIGSLLYLQWRTAKNDGLLREGAPVHSGDFNARLIAFPLGALASTIMANISTQWSFTAFMAVVLVIRVRRKRMERAAKK